VIDMTATVSRGRRGTGGPCPGNPGGPDADK